ncbi:YARHG domain-containing protein [Fulvivirga lutea]|uniref:YARHG domain-containing protein n=1 Tax=Fulvivirga lutea TaxID=2810512 RepID=A0A975A1P1_9BACT|nr:YARHG domain-containing protein [Fulvivirga lutea]QSE98036.1 YARHG domain-containing protein [Fulvivirga lutea]
MNQKITLILIGFLFEPTLFGQTLELSKSNWLYEPPSSPDNYLIFDSDKVLYSQDFLNCYEGIWEVTNDTIYFNFNIYKGYRGVGNINPSSTMDYPSYSKNIPTINQIEITAKGYINQKNIMEFYLNNNPYPYIFQKVDIAEFNINNLNIVVNGDYIDTSIRIIPLEELKTYSKKELRLMRNEIFARYGYVFSSDDLRTHFNLKKWYKPDSTINPMAESFLSEIEKQNIKTIKSLE